jgi:glycine cleavage system H lipoate-binding protein
MSIPGNLKYAKSHEWLRSWTTAMSAWGITDHAQNAMVVLCSSPAECGRRA